MSIRHTTDIESQTTITAPTLEAAVSSLCEKVFGAKLHIEAPQDCSPPDDHQTPTIPGPPNGWLLYGQGPLKHPGACGGDLDVAMFQYGGWDFTKWEGCRDDKVYAIRAGSELARLNGLEPAWPQDQTVIEAQRERDEAVADTQEQREEVKRLATMLDNCQSGNRSFANEVDALKEKAAKNNADLFAYAEFTRNVATALGMGTREISLKEVLEKIELQATWRDAWSRACKQLEKVTTERNDLTAERDRLKASLAEITDAWQQDHMEMKRKLDAAATIPEKTYRGLVPGEIISKHDEFLWEGKWKTTACGGEEYHPSSTESKGNHLPHRRQV